MNPKYHITYRGKALCGRIFILKGILAYDAKHFWLEKRKKYAAHWFCKSCFDKFDKVRNKI